MMEQRGRRLMDEDFPLRPMPVVWCLRRGSTGTSATGASSPLHMGFGRYFFAGAASEAVLAPWWACAGDVGGGAGTGTCAATMQASAGASCNWTGWFRVSRSV